MPDFIYVNNLSPFLFQTQLWGQTIGVRWYGLAYVLGLCLALLAFRYAAQRGFLRGLHSEAQQMIIVALTAGVPTPHRPQHRRYQHRRYQHRRYQQTRRRSGSTPPAAFITGLAHSGMAKPSADST